MGQFTCHQSSVVFAQYNYHYHKLDHYYKHNQNDGCRDYHYQYHYHKHNQYHDYYDAGNCHNQYHDYYDAGMHEY
jgi:hypothetical protein